MKASFRSIGIAAAALVTIAAVAPATAQQGQPAAPAPAAGQQGRPAPAALPDGPWDIRTETGLIHVSVLTKDLQSPWGLAFLPDGGMLVTERPGRLRVIRDGKLDPKPIDGLPDLVATGISGLFGIALHPDFARNRLVYFAYPKPQPTDRDALTLAVARARWDGGAALADVKDIFVAKDWYSTAMSRDNNRCCGQGPSSGSFGARLEFDKENRLYITSGDRNWGEKSQDPQSHIGKIVRVNDDGSVPNDNPFVRRNGYLPEIYTMGHRNQTGLRFDPATGDLWSTEFGPAGGDELNRIEAGKNYGWLLITHGNHYNNEEKKLGTGGVEGYVDPVIWWPRGGNPGNLIVYRGDVFPAWQGNVLIATMSNRALGPGLVRAVIGDNGALVHEERMLKEIGNRMRDVVEGPDGKVYVLTESSAFASPGAILVLEPGVEPTPPPRQQ